MELFVSRESALDLMRTAPSVILTTLDEKGLPWSRAMLNLWNAELYPSLQGLFAESSEKLEVYFTTNTSSGKVKDIERNPNVAVYYHRPEQWWGLMLGGTLKIEKNQSVKTAFWQPSWSLYCPGGSEDEDYTILRFRPTTGRLYNKLQSAEIRPGTDQ